MEERQVKLINVGLLGLAFMLVFTAFQTLGNVQPIILDSARNESSGGYVDGLFIYEKFNFILIKLLQLFSYFLKDLRVMDFCLQLLFMLYLHLLIGLLHQLYHF